MKELRQMFLGGSKSEGLFTRNIANISENVGTEAERDSSDGEIDEIEKLLLNSGATTTE